MKYSIFLVCAALSISNATFCQSDKYTYYFDKDLKITSKARSVLTGSGSKDSGLVLLNCFNNTTGVLTMSAYFTDSTLKINHGLFKSFYSNGHKETEGNYVYNKESGNWKKWDSLGYLIDSSIYEEGKKILGDTFEYHKNGILRSEFLGDTKNDKHRATYFDDKGTLIRESIFNGSSGTVKYRMESGEIKTDSVSNRGEIHASFPGGDSKWNLLIKQIIEKNFDKLIADNKSGTCRVKFTVNPDGTITDVEALTMKGSLLADLFMTAIKKGPKWIPAQQYGHYLKAYREQPVSFVVSN